MTARPSSCHCICQDAVHTPSPPEQVVFAFNEPTFDEPTFTRLSSPAPSTPSTPPKRDLALLVRFLVSELNNVKSRLPRVEADVVVLRDAFAVERRRHATPTHSELKAEEETGVTTPSVRAQVIEIFAASETERRRPTSPMKTKPQEEEITIETPLLLPLLDDSEAESSSSDTESEFEVELVPQPTGSPKRFGREGTGKAVNRPRAAGKGQGRRRECAVETCRSHAKVRGLCYRHSDVPRPRCSKPGCVNIVYRYGKCKRHGAMRQCHEPGCLDPAQCEHHGGKRQCSEVGCSNMAIRRGRCRAHNGVALCVVKGCSTLARRAGKCLHHDRKGAASV